MPAGIFAIIILLGSLYVTKGEKIKQNLPGITGTIMFVIFFIATLPFSLILLFSSKRSPEEELAVEIQAQEYLASRGIYLNPDGTVRDR